MSAHKGFLEPGRHSAKARGIDVQVVPELVKPSPGTYSIVPAAAVSDRRLGRCSPLHVLVALGRYRNAETGLCVPSIGRVAAELGLGRRSVQKHINTLIECGYLVAAARRRRNGGWSTNAYTLLFPGTAAPPDNNDDGGGGYPTGTGQSGPSRQIWAKERDASLSDACPRDTQRREETGGEPVGGEWGTGAPSSLPSSELAPRSKPVDAIKDPDLGAALKSLSERVSKPYRNGIETVSDEVVNGIPHASLNDAWGEAELRNPCVTELRKKNSPILTIDSNSPSAEAVGVASKVCATADSAGVACADRREDGSAPKAGSVPVAAARHEARQWVRVPKAKPICDKARDPLGDLVKRLVKQVRTSEVDLWVLLIGWHEQIERTGLDSVRSHAILVSIVRSVSYGPLEINPIRDIDARVHLWVSRRASAAA